MIETSTIPPLNRKAIFSFIAALLAVLSFCAGFIPLPFTAIVCYPPGILLSLTSLILGSGALREIRHNGESGRPLALIAAWIGGIIMISILCLTSTGILLWPHVMHFIQQNLHSARP